MWQLQASFYHCATRRTKTYSNPRPTSIGVPGCTRLPTLSPSTGPPPTQPLASLFVSGRRCMDRGRKDGGDGRQGQSLRHVEIDRVAPGRLGRERALVVLLGSCCFIWAPGVGEGEVGSRNALPGWSAQSRLPTLHSGSGRLEPAFPASYRLLHILPCVKHRF